ncbi:GNAT family N-acetyltransferase [Neobacillus niacini]|uniref:GNAT family N-acetyltransferase n=1 Tax=Neobacillus niacini TaxID=86668 RepID=UPI002FFDA765
MNIKWDEVTIDHLHHYEKVLPLYDSVFPIGVREPHEVFLKGLHYTKNQKPNSFRFLVGLDGEQLVSFATGHYLEVVNAGFIVYIATNPLIRGKGVGSKTLLKMEELLREDAIASGKSNLDGIILETETQEIVHTHEEKENCLKRNQFFERNHYKKVNKINYLQPPLHMEHEPIPLNLFIKGIQMDEFHRETIIKFIHAIYKEKYSLVNGINEQVLKDSLRKMELDQESS